MLRRLAKGMLAAGRNRQGPAGSLAGEELLRDLATLPASEREIVERALPLTMTGVPRLAALIDAVRYCVRRGIPGAFAECGVWRGGSLLTMVLMLQQLGAQERDIYAYDTFEGMTAPTPRDVSPLDRPALDTWEQARRLGRRPWEQLFDPRAVSEEAVRANLLSTGYPAARLKTIPGPVQETLPPHAPERLALLRLDTDWYESTRHELVHLYPRLSEGGVLIIDDYGHWEGCRQAVDEYFGQQPDPPLLCRIDYTARIAVKH